MQDVIEQVWTGAKQAASRELSGVWGTDPEDVAQDIAVLEIERCTQTKWKARMLAKDRKRAESRRRVTETRKAASDEAGRVYVSALDALVSAEQREAVAAAVDALPPIEQAIVRARYWDGLGVSEVARRTGIGRNRVVRILLESLETIKEALQ